jgi:diguanylate cyclase (GGDEF)-like protein/PAS domain S-box-containing protein
VAVSLPVSTTSRFQTFAKGTASAVLVIGSFALVGQVPAIVAPLPRMPEFGTVRAATTLLILLLGLSLWLTAARAEPFRRLHARLCASLVIVSGILALIVAMYGAGAVWLQGSLMPAADMLRMIFGGTLPINASLSFIALGTALLLIDVETENGRRPSEVIALCVLVYALIAVIGHAYSADVFFHVPGSPALPIDAALSFGVLALGTLASLPDSRLLRLVTSDSAGGRIIRSLPGALVAGPLVFGWLTLELQRAHVWDATLTLSVFVVLNTALLALVILAVAISIDRADLRRRLAEQSARVKAAHQASVATLGQRALSGIEINQLIQEGAEIVAATLHVHCAEVVERENDETMRLRASTGWSDQELEDARSETTHALAAYTASSGVPVVVEHFGQDARFAPAPSRLTHVVSGLAVVVPKTPGRMFGVLAAYSRSARAFGRDDIRFLQTVAALLGSALDRARTEDSLRRSEAKFANVFRSCPDSIALSSVATGRFVDINESFLRLTGYSRDEVIGRTSAELQIIVRPSDRALLIDAARSGLGRSGMELDFRHRTGEVRTGLCFTELVRLGDEECLLSLSRDISDRKKVEAMAEEVNEHLRRSIAELERQTREISLLNDMSDLLQSCMSVGEASTIVTQFARQLFPDDAGALCLLSDSGVLIEAVGTWGDLDAAECLFKPSECWALRRGRPHVVHEGVSLQAQELPTPAAPDQAAGLRCPHLTVPGLAASICVPMIAQNETLGLLHVRRAVGLSPNDEERSPQLAFDAKRRLAVTLAEHVALAIANLKLRDTLRRQSIRDQLTGLLNRRYMEEALEREIRRAARSQSELSLVMLDVDRLKQVNDAHGHEAGDTLLQTVSQFLQRRTREDDILCRLGGDEFVLVMPGASLADARERAEHLLADVRRVTIDFAGEADFAPSLSMGLAVYPAHATTGQSLLRAADLALYRAKAEGRDRLAVGQAAQ